MKDNWYYFYDKKNISDKDLKDLSSGLEKLGYKYRQPMGLGAGPDLEQIILWVNNNQFISGVAIGIVSNYFYDLLKMIGAKFYKSKQEDKAIPVIEIFLHFKDIKSLRTKATFKFRLDKPYSKKELEDSVSKQINILRSSSEQHLICYYCHSKIYRYTGFYLMRNNLHKYICQDCLMNGKYKKKK